MNRSERLLKLLQILRSYRYPVTGQRLAERLGVSIRTLYRDIACLQNQGAEITGEAGIGYLLKPSYFLPPLMFSHVEMEALLLGARWVQQYGDKPLSQAAQDSLSKILAVLPKKVSKDISSATLRVGPPASTKLENEDLSLIRDAITRQLQLEITFKVSDEESSRKSLVWPFSIGYFTDQRILVTWAEEENCYQQVRTALISQIKVLDERYTIPKERLFRDWQALQLKKLKQNS